MTEVVTGPGARAAILSGHQRKMEHKRLRRIRLYHECNDPRRLARLRNQSTSIADKPHKNEREIARRLRQQMMAR